MTNQIGVPSKRTFHELDGLRGIASLMVLGWHLSLTYWVDHNSDIHNWIKEQFTNKQLGAAAGYIGSSLVSALINGHFAVVLFWIISGFVLSIAFYSNNGEQQPRSLLASAFIRRYPRLAIPVVCSTVFAWMLLKAGWMSNILLASEFGDSYNSWLGSMYRFEPDIFLALKCGLWDSFFLFDRHSSYNNSLWTIEKELLGSWLLFGYLAIFGSLRARWVVVGVASAILINIQMSWIICFLIGSLMCSWFFFSEGEWQSWLKNGLFSQGSRINSYGCLSIVSFYWLLLGLFEQFDSLLIVVAAIGVALAVILHPLHFILRSAALQFVGKASFGLYLLHVPLICFLARPMYKVGLGFGSESFARVFGASTIASFAVMSGWLFGLLVDRFSIVISKKVSKLICERDAL